MMNNKLYVKKIVRSDGLSLVFDGVELFLAEDNELLRNADIDTSKVDYTDIDGGEMLRQRYRTGMQSLRGLVFPKTSDYWTLYSQVMAFFKINYTYKIVHIKRNGDMFAQRNAWIVDNIQMSPRADEGPTEFALGMELAGSERYEYAEDDQGVEGYVNNVLLPLISTANGGIVWDGVGMEYDTIGAVWSESTGGIQNISVTSARRVYPVWVVKGLSIRPVIQNNSTDTLARYNGTIAEDQTLVVDFKTGEARIDGALVTRNVDGVVYMDNGINTVGFNSDGGSAVDSTVSWNNALG